MAKTWGYARVSTDAQRDNTSLPEQEARIRAWARSRGMVVDEVVSEVASGSDLRRPVMERLRAGLRSGDTIVVNRLDRLSRSIVDADPLIQSWADENISLFSVMEPLETGSAMGRAMYRLVLLFAQTERELIAERMASGKRRNAEGGRCNGRPAPFGYRRGGTGERDFEVVPDQAGVVRELFSSFSRGRMGMTRLRAQTRCPLSESGIALVLANPFYTGRIRHGGIVRFNDHERLVSDRLFNRVQDMLASRARTHRSFFKVRENKDEVVEFHRPR